MSGSMKAIVRGGRLVLDEPTDLPEGTQVSLVATELDEDAWRCDARAEAPTLFLDELAAIVALLATSPTSTIHRNWLTLR